MGAFLDEKLNFDNHILKKNRESEQGNCDYQTTFYKSSNKNVLLTVCKPFTRPHLDYRDILYDQSDNESFVSKLEQVQYNPASAIVEGY